MVLYICTACLIDQTIYATPQVSAVQFHPEKSGTTGLALLQVGSCLLA